MNIEHLVLVPGHAVWSGAGDPADASSWFFNPRHDNESSYLIEHLRVGIALAKEPDALLILAGGPTDRRAGPLSEALGYWLVAGRLGLWGSGDVRERCALEEYSLDSFQNVLFGLCRFHEWTGRWPARVTVAGWGFKSQRIAELHRHALRWTRPFEAIAVNEPPTLERASANEARTRSQWSADPYGAGSELAGKRAGRDFLHRTPPYALTCPEVAGLLAHLGPEIFPGSVPWDASPRLK